MAEYVPHVFVPFKFEVNLYDEQSDGEILCSGLFSEVSGLEMTMEPKAISEGGLNSGEYQRVGSTRYSPIVLKRGVSKNLDLWNWFDSTTRGANYGYRLHGEINVLGHEVSEKGNPQPIMIWKLAQVLPTRFKGPDLSAMSSQVAIEELTLVHEGLTLHKP